MKFVDDDDDDDDDIKKHHLAYCKFSLVCVRAVALALTNV